MTKTDDIRRLIAEDITRPAERKALHELTDRLQEVLEEDVPYRPEFKAELRQKLMAQARRSMSPWYRRSSVLYSSMGLAAAALVMAIGLQVYRKSPGPVPAAPQTTAETGTAPRVAASPTFPVSSVTLPPVRLPDQVWKGEAPVSAAAVGVDLTNIRVYRLTGVPDAALAARIAQGMGFTQAPRQTEAGFYVAEAGRALTVQDSGLVWYTDDEAGSPSDPPLVLDASAVRSAAQSLLVKMSLPVPGVEPVVRESSTARLKHMYTATYTPAVDGRPVINGLTVVSVTDRYKILAVDAFTPTGEEVVSTSGYTPRSPDDALAEARKGGGKFTQVDLVYARTADEKTVYLQPVWRAFGSNAQGQNVVRYIAALIQK